MAAERIMRFRDGRFLDARGERGMSWLDTLRSGFEAITSHRMRSSLTVLGILIGIAAVILTVGLGEGATASVNSAINSLGTNLLIVTPGSTTTGLVRGGFGSASTLTYANSQALANKVDCPDIAGVAPQVPGDEPWSPAPRTGPRRSTGPPPPICRCATARWRSARSSPLKRSAATTTSSYWARLRRKSWAFCRPWARPSTSGPCPSPSSAYSTRRAAPPPPTRTTWPSCP